MVPPDESRRTPLRSDAVRMRHLNGSVSGPRPGRMRPRRRPARGPFALPGPLSPHSVPAHRTAREEFDALVADVLSALDVHFRAEPDPVDVVVEDVPLLPEDWGEEEVPTSSIARDGRRTRLILYRRPLTEPCDRPAEVLALVWETLLERLGEIWHVSPDDLDPR